MTATRSHLACLASLALAAAAPAAAGERGAGTRYDRASFPYGELASQPLTLPRTMLRIDLPVVVNLSRDEVGKPWSVPLAVDYGVTDGIQAGVFHEVGLCLAGRENGCARTYDDVGARLAISLARTPSSQLALEANTLVFAFRDTQVRAGAALAYKRTLADVAAVELRAGADAYLTDRDLKSPDELLFADVLGVLQLGDGFAVTARIRGEKALEDTRGPSFPFAVPVALGAEAELVRRVSLGAELSFDNLLGERSTSDARTLTVFLRGFI